MTSYETYKMGIKLCLGGTEHVHMERLSQGDGGGKGVLANEPIGSAAGYLTVPFLRKNAWKKNEDGSFLNEGQLRKLWKEFVVPHCCDSARCNGCCAALPGDTVYWHLTDWGYPESYKYEPATQEELEERGWLQYGPGGMLVANARIGREDPSQLEEGDNEWA